MPVVSDVRKLHHNVGLCLQSMLGTQHDPKFESATAENSSSEGREESIVSSDPTLTLCRRSRSEEASEDRN